MSDEKLWDESLTSRDFLKTLLKTQCFCSLRSFGDDKRVCCFMKYENMCHLFFLQNTVIRLMIPIAIWVFFKDLKKSIPRFIITRDDWIELGITLADNRTV